ncbi:HDIG domain-containing protein [Clostridium sp. SYSU_GA19001]|uniref:HDIG domain-containing metalloprotein n=1 Tax=Clostridium caldaquaticum TaxID=2940653 RepID=UPI0020776FB2|nr:HDIG domain-containing metalloprotein [Clostridium caldaquaticum]MCM8711346.1 HDIG domain-containing protein [Clostridium caldaquaticum]
MSLYRIKQFYWSITSKIELEDRKFIDKYLNNDEKKLFNKLSVYEQKHCINTARDVIKACKDAGIINEMLIKAALLHDIGKTCKKLNPIEKSLIVILDSISKGKLKKFSNIKKIDVYYNHAYKGYNILKDIGNYDDRFLYLIKNHHNNTIKEDKELDILKKCDSKN